MIKLISALLVSALFALPAGAEGKHGGGHGHDESQDQSSSHDDHSTEKMHQHDDKKGPVGSPAQAADAQKTILVSLTDKMRINFDAALSEIKSGTIIQFIINNDGKIPHEFSIGNQAEQKEHAEMMRTMPGMTHADGNTVTVEPGKSKTLTWQFEGDDVVVFACNIPGHYEAGMYRKVPLSE